MPKAEKIAKEIAKAENKPCKHGFELTHRTCAYCQGYPISEYKQTTKSAWLKNVGYTISGTYHKGGA